MLKKLFFVGSLLLMLTLGFLLVPAHVAHADSCNSVCGQDPVQAGCTSTQTILASTDFWVGGSLWEIRLRGTNSHSSACNNKVWASMVLLSGTNFLGNSYYIGVFSGSQYDVLVSSQFQSGAYTNMITHTGSCTYAEYDGASTSASTNCA